MYYKCHKTNFKSDGSHIDSLDWKKSKIAAINPINKNDNKCFQYAVTVAINHEKIEKNLQRILKVKPFVGKCNWEEISYPSVKDNWEKFEKKLSSNCS